MFVYMILFVQDYCWTVIAYSYMVTEEGCDNSQHIQNFYSDNDGNEDIQKYVWKIM